MISLELIRKKPHGLESPVEDEISGWFIRTGDRCRLPPVRVKKGGNYLTAHRTKMTGGSRKKGKEAAPKGEKAKGRGKREVRAAHSAQSQRMSGRLSSVFYFSSYYSQSLRAGIQAGPQFTNCHSQAKSLCPTYYNENGRAPPGPDSFLS